MDRPELLSKRRPRLAAQTTAPLFGYAHRRVVSCAIREDLAYVHALRCFLYCFIDAKSLTQSRAD